MACQVTLTYSHFQGFGKEDPQPVQGWWMEVQFLLSKTHPSLNISELWILKTNIKNNEIEFCNILQTCIVGGITTS